MIATLADDLDAPATASTSRYGGAPLVGLVATAPEDRGLIGDGWYIGTDKDQIDDVKPSDEAAAAERILATGYGKDSVPDVLGVALHSSVAHMDEQLKAIVQAAQKASGGSVVVAVAGTGSAAAANASTSENPSSMISTVEKRVKGTEPVVQAAVPGGLFLDQQVLADEDISPQTVVTALLGLHASGGGPLLADAFRSSLSLDYPVALADDETRAGSGPFGFVARVPTLVVLDATRDSGDTDRVYAAA